MKTRKKPGFSMIEMMTLMVVLSVVLACLAPIMSKKVLSNQSAIANDAIMSLRVKEECSSKWADCTLCSVTECLFCEKKCSATQTMNVAKCICE